MCFLPPSRGRSSEISLNIKRHFAASENHIFIKKKLCLSDRMYSNCTGPFFTVHSDITMPYISKYGSKEQIEHFIPQMTAGRFIGAIAMTEPGAGRSGLQRTRKTARLAVM